MSALLELAERVEAAAGPDRELDALITIEYYGFPEKAYAQRNGMRPQGSPEIDRMAFMRDGWSDRYTASIDAAMTLVPEGVTASVTWGGPASGALLWRGDPRKNGHFGDVKAATPALALCAASLRAHASGETE